MFTVGVAKTEITAYEPRLGMMGWGMLDNVVESVATPLHARAFYVEPPGGGRLVMVVCELAFISLALRQRVVELLPAALPQVELGLPEVMLMATHTHSGPGGFTHYPFYNVTIPGFSQTVLDALAEKIVEAIASAYEARQPAVVRYTEDAFAPQVPIAWNRSIEAYNLNPEVVPVTDAERHLALDRTMRMLRFDSEDGKPLGSINWFAVHGTSVHSDNTAIHFDNKGYAAQMVEEALAERGHEGYVAAFAQAATGDVTPNNTRHPGRPFMRGRYADDDDSARFCGRLQADHALALLEGSEDAEPLPESLHLAHTFEDFSNIEAQPRYAEGHPGRRTAPAEIGIAMFFGTEEGPGLPRSLRFVQSVVATARAQLRRWVPEARWRDHASTQAEKVPLVESGRRRFLGISKLRKLPLPWQLHPALRLVRQLDNDEPEPKPWTPAVLPIHLAVVGGIAIAAAPLEITTTAGRRIRAALGDDLVGLGVTHTVLAGYANAYSGYLTTPQEYALQDYEGASTHFGKWTLPAVQTIFGRLAQRLVGSDSIEVAPAGELRPPEFSRHELAQRSFPA